MGSSNKSPSIKL